MYNKKIFKELYSKKINKDNNYKSILERLEGREKIKMSRIMKYVIVPGCFIFIVLGGILLNNDKNIISSMKVYAYTMSEGEELEKIELKDNIKLGLASYNLAMSSVPGYPIVFEFDNVDYINIDVNNGTIFDWDRATGNVKSLGNIYKLSNEDTLYFDVNINTNIKITGIKNKREVFEKNIIISCDDAFNYYATIK